MSKATMPSSHQWDGGGRRRGIVAGGVPDGVPETVRENTRVSCEETRSLCSRSQADQDRVSDWNSRSCRQSIIPSTTVNLKDELSATVQHRVRGHHMIWTFRTREDNLIATIIVDGECHPVSQLHKFTFNEDFTGKGLTQPMWEHVESMLLSLHFEDVLYDAARHMTDEEIRGSLGKFYEMQGVSLEHIQRSDVGPLVDRWTVQMPSDVRASDLGHSNPIKIPPMTQAIPEGKNRSKPGYPSLL